MSSPTPATGLPVSRFPKAPLPQRAGAGFKPSHLEAIMADRNPAGFFEVHAENYMGAGGPPHRALEMLRANHPVSVHGVGLSIGSEKGIDPVHLDRLAGVIERYEPGMVSEHLAWSTHETGYLNDLLPVPYTQAVLDRVVAHISMIQDRLKRRILLENPSTYVVFEESEMEETTFIRDIARRTGCGLLLDINNVFVSASNHGYDPIGYLMDFPLDQIEEIHLAGHGEDEDDAGLPILIDSHDRPVADPVWSLYETVISWTGALPTLIEWDNDVPEWHVLKREAERADVILGRAGPLAFMGQRHAG